MVSFYRVRSLSFYTEIMNSGSWFVGVSSPLHYWMNSEESRKWDTGKEVRGVRADPGRRGGVPKASSCSCHSSPALTLAGAFIAT